MRATSGQKHPTQDETVDSKYNFLLESELPVWHPVNTHAAH